MKKRCSKNSIGFQNPKEDDVMSQSETSQDKALPLRAVNSKLFQLLQAELDAQHIHSYDIEAIGAKKEDGTEVTLKYGDAFRHVKSQYFSNSSIEANDPAISQYFKEVGEDCQKVLVADYFKMMKP
jgi:hypothetical protein